MGVSVQRYCGVFMPQYLRQCFHVHSAFQSACSKRMPKRVKTFTFDMQTLLQKFKGSLIRLHRRRLALLRFHNILRNAFPFILFQNGKQLLRKRNHSFGRSCFRQVRDPTEIPVFTSSVVASFVHRKRSFREINICSSKRKQFSDTQTRIKTNHDPDEFPFLTRQHRLLYLLLLSKRKTRYFFLFRFRSSDFVCRILFQFSERICKFQRVLNHRNNPVYGISRQSLSGCQITRLHQLGDILLYDYGRQFLKLIFAQLYLQVLFDNLRISFARFRFRRRLYVVRKPYV